MAQIKIYGRRAFLQEHVDALSDCIHRVAVAELGLPADKRFHRFIPLDDWQQRAPADRSERYVIIEVLMFTGRSVEVRKGFLRGLMTSLARDLSLSPADVEVTLIESPRENWGIRGQTADELQLNYQVEV